MKAVSQIKTKMCYPHLTKEKGVQLSPPYLLCRLRPSLRLLLHSAAAS